MIAPVRGAIVTGLRINGIELAETWYPAGARTTQLTLNEIEVMFVSSGELSSSGTTAHTGLRWKAGSAILRRLDVSAPLTVIKACRIISVRAPSHFRGADPRRLHSVDSWIRLPDGAADDLRRLQRELSAGASETSLRVEGLALLALAWAEQAIVQSPAESERPQWLTGVMERLSDVSRTLSIRKLAEDAGVNTAHLTRVFRHVEGCTIAEYQRKLRVAMACRMLQATAMPLSRVALAAGFTDQAHFSKIFKRQTGATPGEYRSSTKTRVVAPTTPQLGFDPIGKYPFRSATADGRPYEGVLEITGSANGYGCVARTSVMPEVVADSVAIHGQHIVMTASVPAGVAVYHLRFDHGRFTGEWRLAGRATPLSGYREGSGNT